MGKIKSKKWRGKRRPKPTGLPSVREAEQQEALEGPSQRENSSVPLLEKLTSSSPNDRALACRALSQLVFELPSIELLMSQQLVKKVAALLVDTTMTVREVAAGTLRNLSVAHSGQLCEQMVKEDVMTPLSIMLKDCVAELQKSWCGQEESMGQDEGEAGVSSACREKGGSFSQKVAKQQVVDALEQAVHLLWNLSECSPVVVEVFNREGLLALLLHLLQPSTYPISLVTAAAQCLHTVTEDNVPSLQLLVSSQETLTQLEQLLAQANTTTGSGLLLKTSVAGVFQNVLAFLSEPVRSQTIRGVLSVLGGVLDIDVSPLLHTLSTTPPPTPPQASGALTEMAAGPTVKSEKTAVNELSEHVKNTLSAQQLALEILANLCYTEGDGDEGGGEWEEVEEEEEEEVMTDMADMETEGQQEFQTELTPVLSIVLQLGIHEKVWRKCCSVDSAVYQACSAIDNGKTIAKRLNTLQGHSLLALRNLVSALPPSGWGGGDSLAAMWSSLLTLLEAGGEFLHSEAIAGAMMVLVEKLNTLGVECLTVEQLQSISQLALSASGDPDMRADVMTILGTAGRMALKNKAIGLQMLSVIGVSLRECISKDSRLWVVCQALDSVFDVFGDDNCPPSVFVDVALMPALQKLASTFKARLKVEKTSMAPHHIGLVQNARMNLPRFIEYMNARTRK